MADLVFLGPTKIIKYEQTRVIWALETIPGRGSMNLTNIRINGQSCDYYMMALL